MQSSNVRRQNSSCDQCRRSKRKCSLPQNIPPGTGSPCLNCLHLEQECTFEFVNSRQAQRRKIPKSASSRDTSTASPNESIRYKYGTAQSSVAMSPDVSQYIQPLPNFPDPSNGPSSAWGQATLDNFGHYSMMMNHVVAEWEHFTRDLSGEDTTASNRQVATIQSASHPSLCSQSRVHETKDQEQSTSALWKGSPIHLLNSSVASQLLNLSLGDVYNSMMSGITTRYLDYNCNLFAGSYKYTFDSEDLGQSIFPSNDTSSTIHDGVTENMAAAKSVSRGFTAPWRKSNCNFRIETLENHTLSPEQVASQISRVTMIGVARFLDNFGALYGNPIEQQVRKQDERVLTAVLQAFALQFAPSNPKGGPRQTFNADASITSTRSTLGASSVEDQTANSSQVFTAAWHHAYSHLLKSQSNRSFVHIYAVFLFQMTVVPPEDVVGKDLTSSVLMLLDTALSQMEDLNILLSAYCKNLATNSLYRFLLESSLSIFRWYGIVRDSIGSILHERPCFMEDPPFRSRGPAHQIGETEMNQWQQPSLFEHDVSSNCQNAAGDLFHLYRQVTQLKLCIASSTAVTETATVKIQIDSAIGLTDAFNSIYGPWLEQCTIMFYRLSEKSKLATAFLLLFWNLSHLCLVEQIHYASHILPTDVCYDMLSKADHLQDAAVTSLLAIARRIVNVSATGEFKLVNSVHAKLQFISHHANTALVVTALVKAIEHTIDLNLFRQSIGSQAPTSSATPPRSNWIPSIKPVLTCLLTLDSTVSGAFTARPALQRLMKQYGDILMDCWSHEDEKGDLP